MTAGIAALIPLSEGTQNFLVPNATFFVELAAFLLLFYLLARFVIPPINRAMTKRQEAIRTQFAELEEAKADARAAEEKFKAQTADARKQAGKIREEAKEQGDQIVAEAREQAQVEAKRIVDHGHAQLEAERKQALALSPRRGRHAGHEARQSHRRGEPRGRRAEQPRGRPLPGRPRDDGDRRGCRSAGRGPLMLRGASAEAQAELTSELEGSKGDADKLAEELFGVAAVLRGEPAVRRILTDASIEPDAKAALAGNVFGNALGETALKLVKSAVQRRWTVSHDLADVIEELGVLAAVRSAGDDGSKISDELFEVRRVVDQTQGLRTALSDPSRSASDKSELLRTLFGGKLLPATMLLVEQAATGSHGAIDGALEMFQHTAAHSHRREDRDRVRRPGALRRRAQPVGRRSRLAVRHRRSICWSCRTRRSWAGSGSRSATTSSTAPSPASSRTPNESSQADHAPPGMSGTQDN